VVIEWLDRKSKRLDKKRKKDKLPKLRRRSTENDPPPDKLPKLKRQPNELSPRFLRDLPIYLKQAEHSVQHAGAVVAHFYVASKEGKRVDPRVIDYIDSARERYCRDPIRNIAKALGLVRRNRGNPGGVSAKRRMTPDAFVEAREMVQQRRGAGFSEKRAVLDIAELFRVSERTIRKAAKETPE
jgi:hypothetical protein